jgi:hypothetical protein
MGGAPASGRSAWERDAGADTLPRVPSRPPLPHVPDRSVGLCSACLHAAVQRSAKGGAFWRCRAADTGRMQLRYPPLPVVQCPAFEEGTPEA